MSKNYEQMVRESTVLERKDELKDVPQSFKKEVERRYNQAKNWDRDKIEQELSKSQVSEGTSASYTPNYISKIGSPRSIALKFALHSKKSKTDKVS